MVFAHIVVLFCPRPDGQPLSKKALKKQQKEAEKAAKKAAHKQQNQQQQPQDDGVGQQQQQQFVGRDLWALWSVGSVIFKVAVLCSDRSMSTVECGQCHL